MYDVRQMPNLDELRRLAAVLPPNYRISGGEVADLLSASLVATEHPDVVAASEEGGAQGVADYFHQHITDNRPDGADEPVKGQAVATQPPAGPVATPVGPSQAQFDELNSKFDQLLSALGDRSSKPVAGATDEPASPAGGPSAPAGTVADQAAAESKVDTGAGA
jgi:hypothetical protein